jgi:hypothetical protein
MYIERITMDNNLYPRPDLTDKEKLMWINCIYWDNQELALDSGYGEKWREHTKKWKHILDLPLDHLCDKGHDCDCNED